MDEHKKEGFTGFQSVRANLKKRKLEHKHAKPEETTVNTEGRKLFKVERKETKRLRRLEKEKRRQAKSADGVSKACETNGNLAGRLEEKATNEESAIYRELPEGASDEGKKSREKALQNANGDAEVESEEQHAISSENLRPDFPKNSQLPTPIQEDIDSFLETNAIIINDPSSPILQRPITKFSQLPSIFDPSHFEAFSAPTPIQSAAWPFLFNGRDMIGVAETGSGKTLAFGVPLVRSMTSYAPSSQSKASCKAVVVSPTRELAVQIHDQLESLARAAFVKTACVYGGVPKDAQRDALKNAHIVVATPGRLNDLIQEGSADISNVRYLVLDEADRMLDKGFEDEIRKIVSATPSSNRQTLMFTATWPESVRKLASTFMKLPVHISIGANNPAGELRANTRITQIVEVIDGTYKQARLLQLLSEHHGKKNRDDRILIFCLYKKEAARIEEFLRRKSHSVAGIHGDMSQPARSASLEGFKSAKCSLLVATDVAARGLDIPAVKVVINFTFPLTVEDYIHRIGRTGRAGKEGLAITLFTDHDKPLAGALINVLKGTKQNVPNDLLKFGTTVKKKAHEAYGAFYKDLRPGQMKTATKIKF